MAKYRGKYHYMGAWKYVLLDILYAIPVIGWICLLVHAFSHSNENRLHYARSYFVRLLLVVILLAALALTVYLTIGFEAVTTNVTEIMEQVKTMPNAL